MNNYRTKMRHAGRMLAVILFTSFGLSGCLGGCIDLPPVTFKITLLNDTALPDTGYIAGFPINDVTVDLPEICNLPSMDEIEAKIRAVVGDWLVDYVEIESVTIGKMSFVASQGTFNSLTSLGLALTADGEVISLGTATSSTGLGASFDLAPDAPVDILDVLFNQAAGECVSGQVTLSGAVPAPPLIFDMTTQITVTVSLGL